MDHQNVLTTSSSSLCGSADSWHHNWVSNGAVYGLWPMKKSEHICETMESEAKSWIFAMMESLSCDDGITILRWWIFACRFIDHLRNSDTILIEVLSPHTAILAECSWKHTLSTLHLEKQMKWRIIWLGILMNQSIISWDGSLQDSFFHL
jgi:hypothetical protein